MIAFEFDEAKSAANRLKHGIDFVQAQVLWQGQFVQTSVPFAAEPRWRVIGAIDDRLWTAIVTYRGDAIRIISVRRARESEMESYARQDDQR